MLQENNPQTNELDFAASATGGKRKREFDSVAPSPRSKTVLGQGDGAFRRIGSLMSPGGGLSVAVAASKRARTEVSEVREEAERVRQETAAERARAVASAGSLR